MFNVFVTDAFVSKGREGEAALHYSEKATSVLFRIGKKVYDPNAENNCRWNFITVKAFGVVCDRIKKMKLKEGSRIHLVGRMDMDEWADKKTGELRQQWVIILDEIEYGYSGGGKSKENQDDGFQDPNGEMQQPVPQGVDPAMMQGYPAVPPQQMPTAGQQAAMPPQAQYAAQQAMPPQAPAQSQMPDPMQGANFTGYEAYGGRTFFQHG